jgi:hypothetical protein
MILADDRFRRGDLSTGFVGRFIEENHQLVAGAQNDAVGDGS